MTVVALVLLAIVLLLGGMLFQYVMRANRLDSVRVVGDGRRTLTPTEPQFYETFQLLTSTPIYEGNQVDLLLNGDETYPRLFGDLAGARKVITCHIFWYRAGTLSDRLRDILIERARSGVKVFLLLDYFGSNLDGPYVEALRAAGVEVEHFRPPRFSNAYKMQQRNHMRTVVIDGEIGYTGGFAIDDVWTGSGREPGQWRDTNVRIVGPAVDQLQAAFITNWAETTTNLLVGDVLFHPGNRAVGNVRCGVMHTAPSLGSTHGERYFILSISAAKERLYITNPYFIPDRDFRRLLCETAKRGVDVRILTPGRNNDKKPAMYASRSHYEELLEGGIRIYEYRPTMVHAKTIVCDGVWFSIGTINFDNRSITLNDEVTAAGHDKELGRRMEQIFFEDLEYADEIDLATFRHRPRSDRWKEKMWRRVELLL